MEREPRYSAERAANVVLAMAVAGAALCGWAGIALLRRGADAGWLLIAVGVLPLAFAVLVRNRVRRPPS
jgi:hypothetical protein